MKDFTLLSTIGGSITDGFCKTIAKSLIVERDFAARIELDRPDFVPVTVDQFRVVHCIGHCRWAHLVLGPAPNQLPGLAWGRSNIEA